MKLDTLLNIHGRLDLRQQAPQIQVKSLHSDSRDVQPGSVYVAIRGHNQDGHQFVQKAIESGAVALVVEDINSVPEHFPGAVLEVLDSRLSLQTLSQKFFGAPGDQMTAIAITGTNGKTSCSYILEHLLNELQRPCGVIGTIDHHIGDQVWETNLTTPDPITLQKRLKDFVDKGGESFVIEASSHALAQNRIDQGFDVTLFTNLSRDHLDYHKDLEDYFLAKAKLFKTKMLKEDVDCMAVINLDDPYGQRLTKMVEGRRVYTIGKNSLADLRFATIRAELSGTEFNLTIGGENNFNVKSPLIGEHNIYNVVSCLAVIYGLGYDLLKAANALSTFPGIPGRMQKIESQSGVYGFVDYAHTPDALEKSILSIKPMIGKKSKLITVFGAGGDRDPGKRPLMGEIATRLSDLTIVTSDNPRTEDAGAIISEICEGFLHNKDVKFLPCIERKEAIEQACQLAEPGDAILVAGKGHENYQIIGTQKVHFDDREVLQECFNT